MTPTARTWQRHRDRTLRTVVRRLVSAGAVEEVYVIEHMTDSELDMLARSEMEAAA